MEIRKEEIDKLLLDSGFRNWALKANTQDFEAWESQLKDDKRLTKLALLARKEIIKIELIETKPVSQDLKSFKRLEAKINGVQKEITDYRETYKVSRFNYNTVVRFAAAISFIVIFSGLLYYNSIKEEVAVDLVADCIHKQTQNGQQLTITLPDGSKVKLNSNSDISYPRDFFNNRQVILEGEAFFEVVRDESSPFVVKTKNFQTEVLGTSFNVDAFENELGKVSVVEGKVKVSNSNSNFEKSNSQILIKEEAANIQGEDITKSKFNLDEILWKDGILVFDNENIETISSKIQRWFNVTVTVKNESAIAGSFTGKYARESLEEILEGMGYALNFDFTMNGNEIIITGKM